MAKKASYGSTKRFGCRYGKTVKDKFGKIETEQKKAHKCPYCTRASVKKEAVGIWVCKHCGSKFTSKANTVAKVPKIRVTTSEI
jgi:large subunit ribosomal protein L37Ae